MEGKNIYFIHELQTSGKTQRNSTVIEQNIFAHKFTHTALKGECIFLNIYTKSTRVHTLYIGYVICSSSSYCSLLSFCFLFTSQAKAKRRFVLGLREVHKHLKLRKVKCVIISSNVERIKSAG